MLAKNVCVWGKTIPLKYNSCTDEIYLVGCNLSDWELSYLIALTWPYVGTSTQKCSSYFISTILSSVKEEQISQRRPSNNQSYF